MASPADTPYGQTALDQDTRGWIMSSISGAACVLGASIIYADVFARKVCGCDSFKIAEHKTFQAASLSLSAGVMIFTSLYSMLPSANEYMVKAGYSASASSYMVIGLFVLGVVVIRIISTVIHSKLPSSVVECEPGNKHGDQDAERGHGEGSTRNAAPSDLEAGHGATERTPLIQNARPGHDEHDDEHPACLVAGVAHLAEQERVHQQPTTEQQHPVRPSLSTLLSQQLRAVALQGKPSCDEGGRCLGFSHPCRPDCIGCSTLKSSTNPSFSHDMANHGQHQEAQRPLAVPSSASALPGSGRVVYGSVEDGRRGDETTPSSASATRPQSSADGSGTELPSSGETTAVPSPASTESHPQHHHHVPQDKFMSLGLQTSLAIALHKLPEGFITFATNHTSPKLGWSVFVALFIHNLTEGFAMCLPLYLALQSRLKAMAWSSFLGGISQPAGAAIAALWIYCARNGVLHPGDTAGGSDDGISWAVYGGLFAGTSGVMTNVGLQLFSEALHLSDSHPLCVGFAIGGMGVLGLSFALTAE